MPPFETLLIVITPPQIVPDTPTYIGYPVD